MKTLDESMPTVPRNFAMVVNYTCKMFMKLTTGAPATSVRTRPRPEETGVYVI
jgi:hypothetical protein